MPAYPEEPNELRPEESLFDDSETEWFTRASTRPATSESIRVALESLRLASSAPPPLPPIGDDLVDAWLA